MEKTGFRTAGESGPAEYQEKNETKTNLLNFLYFFAFP